MAITPPTPDQVRAITGSTLDDAMIQPFIDAAVCIAEQVQFCMNGKGLSDERQAMVSAYVAAHILSTSKVGEESSLLRSEQFENYAKTYLRSSSVGNGIMSSPYGETANTLSGGCLQEIDKRPFQITFGGGA